MRLWLGDNCMTWRCMAWIKSGVNIEHDDLGMRVWLISDGIARG